MSNRKWIVLSLTLLFGFVSWHYLSSFYFLGSHEATSIISKRPAIVDWDRFHLETFKSVEELLDQDTFLNFSGSKKLEIVAEPAGRPKLYVKGDSSIYPVLIQERTSGLPYLLVRVLQRWTNPTLALGLFTWLTSFGTFLISLFYIRRTSGMSLPFAIFAITVPQMFYFLYSQYPDSELAFFFILLLLFLLDGASKPIHFVLIGLTASMVINIKMASAIYFPALIVLHWSRIWKNKKALFLSALPLLVFLFVITNQEKMKSIIMDERELFKSLSFHLDVLKHFLFDLINPDLLLPYLLNGEAVIPEIIKNNLWEFVPVFIVSLVSFTYFLKIGLNRGQVVKLFGIGLLHWVMITVLATEMNDDLYDYMAQGTYLLIVVFFSFFRPVKNSSPKLIPIFFLLLILARLFVMGNWNSQFRKLTKNLSGCVWIYQCMLADWEKEKWLEGKPLITLNLLDVGQLEYFSEEKRLPIHATWKIKRNPTGDELRDFLTHFPYSEFLVLGSGPPDGRDLSDYNLSEASLNEGGLSIEVIRSYDYPAFGKSYRLMKMTRR